MMVVRVPADVEAAIRAKVASGRFDDEGAVIREALEALALREEAQRVALRAKVLAGFESGGGIELTAELLDDMERESEARFQRGEQPNPDVCP